MRVHSIADIFPRMSAAEYAALRDDIQKNGQREPIWVWNDQIIDGRHRAQACEELGIEPASRQYDGDESTLVAFVVSLNLHRRHLDESQRAMVAGKLATLGRGRPEGNASIDAITQTQAAELLNVSRPSVQRAREVIDKGAPDLVQAVERGDVSVSLAAQVVDLPEEEKAIVESASPEEIRAVAREVVHNHRALGTGENEWYTPPEYIESAREVLGAFDLDPASSEHANRTIRAARFFSADDDGLAQKWRGRIWMNPPYAQPYIAQFMDKLAGSFEDGEVAEAIALTHNYTDTSWFHRGVESCSAICFTRGRIGFLSPDGKRAAPTQGQAFFYFGNNTERFVNVFSAHGFVVEIAAPHRQVERKAA